MAYADTKLKPEEFAVGSSFCLQMAGTQVGLFRTAEGMYALDNACPHRGAPLHDGVTLDGYVTCPWHQWQFQLKDGKCRNIPGASVASYPLEVHEGTIWVDLQPGTPIL